MSEAQALKDDEIEITEEVTEEITGESEEVEIVIEGEDQPSSQGVPYGVQKRLKKLTEKVETANAGKSEAEQQVAMLQAEVDLLKLEKGQTGKRPNEDDFDSRAEYLDAETNWLQDQIEKGADKVATKRLQAVQTNTQVANQDEHLKGKITQHYERAETLKMRNYEDLEDKAIDALGNDFAKQIMANSSQSHLILGHLGANPAKAEALRALAKTDPLKAYTEALEIGGKLSIKGKKDNAPDPETKVDSGSGSSSAFDKKIEAARAKAAETGDMSELMALKKQARQAGQT